VGVACTGTIAVNEESASEGSPSRMATNPAVRPQPGVKWSEEQLKKAVAPGRAGAALTPKSWPNNAKVAVCLSFDIDNESPTLAQGITLPVPLSGQQYGATQGMPRILELLDRDKLPASFYTPAVSAILAPDMIPAIMKSGRHEIAVHGWIHEN